MSDAVKLVPFSRNDSMKVTSTLDDCKWKAQTTLSDPMCRLHALMIMTSYDTILYGACCSAPRSAAPILLRSARQNPTHYLVTLKCRSNLRVAAIKLARTNVDYESSKSIG
eukprot:scaffold338100_cov18-Prasinocladus_malaysianus.AAC.1